MKSKIHECLNIKKRMMGKKFILASAAVLFIALTAFAQNGIDNKKWYVSESDAGSGISRDIMFEVRGKYSRSVTKEKLDEANLLRDVIDGYPVNWISDYVSVEISSTCDGKAMQAVSMNETLNAEQKNILKKADQGAEISLKVKYKYKNSVTEDSYNHEMKISMMIIPETEAEFIGGYQLMAKYLTDNVINKISETIPKQFQQGAVTFTINEKGEIIKTRISITSGDPRTDKLLVDAINKMPKWKPAQNSKGIKVKQEFVFNVGNSGC